MTRPWIDATRALGPDLPVYPGDLPIQVERLSRIERGAAFDLSALHFSAHAGTHIDAPAHFIAGGTPVDALDPARLVCAALVVAASHQIVGPQCLPEGDVAGMALLFKTQADGAAPAKRYDVNHAWLDEALARLLVERGAGLVGTDAADVDRHGSREYPVHRILLGAGIPIVEGLDLSGVAPGRYEMIALPLRIEDGEASPARVLLRPAPEEGDVT